MPLSVQAFGEEPHSPEQVPADPVYLDMIASPTSYEACYADMSLVSVLTHALADAFLSFSEEASRRCAMGGSADASFPLPSSPLCSSPTHAVWPLYGGRRAAPHTELSLEEPLSENELRGLSGCRFLQRFFRSPAVLGLATGQGVARPTDKMVCARLASGSREYTDLPPHKPHVLLGGRRLRFGPRFVRTHRRYRKVLASNWPTGLMAVLSLALQRVPVGWRC
eukprot:COSAG03_NODE_1240_length_4488_cov_19.178173_6_plen_223_part_00